MGHEKILWVVDRGSKRTLKWTLHVFRTRKAAREWAAKQNRRYWVVGDVERAVWGPDNT